MKRRLRVYKKTVSIVNETAIGMYESLVGNKKGFLLESYDKNYDRYTFFGKEPEEIITSRGDALVIRRNNGTEEIRQGNPLERLKEYYSEFDIVKENEELSFSGGLVGNLGYDFVRYAEVLPDNNPDEIGIETIQMMLMTKFILVDHVAETLTAVILGEDSEDGKKKALAEAAELIEEARKNAGQIPDRNFTHDGVIVNQSDTLEQYCEKVEKIKQYIREGHIFQTVLSQRWTIETKQTGFELYKELRELNPSPYLYYFNYGEFEVIGSSPEMIVKQQGSRVYTCPIAGTRRRGVDAEEDALLRDELLRDEKERAEHYPRIWERLYTHCISEQDGSDRSYYNSHDPPHATDYRRLDEELRHYACALCAYRLSYTDFTGTLRNRYKHYIHNSYTADNKRNSRNARREQRHHGCYLAQRIHHAGNADDVILVLVLKL